MYKIGAYKLYSVYYHQSNDYSDWRMLIDEIAEFHVKSRIIDKVHLVESYLIIYNIGFSVFRG